ncbi:MAG: isopentenyl phosphate kinase family protein [Candidatus Diapherotrites archaeon]|nr:isopentenyl phosphate kinase family protein [Candidatus Diapherotrites archaeon]
MNLIIIKLGGSAITKKSENKAETNKKLLHNICVDVSKIKGKKIIVHGAGAYGHKPVKEFKINNGIKTEKQVHGFTETRASVQKLNNEVMQELIKCGINAVSVNPFDVIIQNNKKISYFDLTKIKKLLELNCVPVLFGDMVLDKSLKASVVSGDAIVPFLAKKLNAEKVLLGTDVNGLFTNDPKKNKKAKHISELNNSNYNEIIKGIKKASTVDVTGGMKGKIDKIKKELKGIKTIVFDLKKKGNILKAINEKTGTKILFK